MAGDQKDAKRVEAFKRRVTDFVSTYGDEYTSGCDVEFHTDYRDDLSAKITLDFFGPVTYVVPVTTDEQGNAAIDIGDAGTLSLDGHGLYAYLFNEADHECRILAGKVEKLESRPPTTVAANGAMLASDTTGMTCPKCDASGPFNVTVMGQVSVDDTGDGSIGFGDMEFDGGAECVCEKCGERGCIREFKPRTLGAYTVVLLYPGHAVDENDLHTYVECVEAIEPEKAEEAVRAKASKANGGDIPAEDFRMVAVFAGDCPLELNGGGI